MFKIIEIKILSENSKKIYLIETSIGTNWYIKVHRGIFPIDNLDFNRDKVKNKRVTVLPILLPIKDHEEMNKIIDTM